MPDERQVIALIPLDERPVNVGLPRDVADIAGFGLVTPAPGVLPRFREPADTTAVAGWLLTAAAAPRTAAAVVSADLLVYGGLIPARTSDDTTAAAIARLEVLRAVRSSRPDLPLSVVSLITRASDAYSNVEEPEYWDRYGRELHGLGRAAHANWRGGAQTIPGLPAGIRDDFARRRLRNHIVNLATLGLRWEGVIDHLSLTADDTAEWSVGSAEQEWLRYWQLLRPAEGVAMHPGADETGAVLVARAILGLVGVSPVVRIIAGDPDGLALVPPYENQPLAESLPRQVAAAGGVVGDAADAVLVVHTADPTRGDQFSVLAPRSDPEAVRRTVAAVRRSFEEADVVALADVRFANGADPALVEALAAEGLLWRLSAYGGWNTAGNAAGGAIATALAVVAGIAAGTLDQAAVRTALARRLADDYAYQAIVRRELGERLFGPTIAPVDAALADSAGDALLSPISARLAAIGAPDAVRIERVMLPWRRSFEVELTLGQIEGSGT
ncbi:MAG: DUF4127 family protein [Rhodoglobus sp.]